MPRMTTKKAMAARKSWQETAETWRAKIKVSQIINRLDSFVEGKVEMSPAQVKAAQVLLDRVMPTLSASEVTKKTETISPEQLIQQMRERYGDQVADMLAKDYMPTEPTHQAPEEMH